MMSKALVLTHAHGDHIGAIPFLLKMRGDIPVVGSASPSPWWPIPRAPHQAASRSVAEGQRSTHGVFECEYFAVNHSIPGSTGWPPSTPGQGPSAIPAI